MSIIVRGGDSTGLSTSFYEVIYRIYTAERFVICKGMNVKDISLLTTDPMDDHLCLVV